MLIKIENFLKEHIKAVILMGAILLLLINSIIDSIIFTPNSNTIKEPIVFYGEVFDNINHYENKTVTIVFRINNVLNSKGMVTTEDYDSEYIKNMYVHFKHKYEYEKGDYVVVTGKIPRDKHRYADDIENATLNYIGKEAEKIYHECEEAYIAKITEAEEIEQEEQASDNQERIDEINAEIDKYSVEEFFSLCKKRDYSSLEKGYTYANASYICLDIVSDGLCTVDADSVAIGVDYQRLYNCYDINNLFFRDSVSYELPFDATDVNTYKVVRVYGIYLGDVDNKNGAGRSVYSIYPVYTSQLCDLLDYEKLLEYENSLNSSVETEESTNQDNPEKKDVTDLLNLSEEEFKSNCKEITNSVDLSHYSCDFVSFDMIVKKKKHYVDEDGPVIQAHKDGSAYTYSEYLLVGAVKGKNYRLPNPNIESYITFCIAEEGNIDPSTLYTGQIIHVYGVYQGVQLVLLYVD